MSTPPSEDRNPRTGPHTGAQAVIADASDPARRPDVLFRVRRPAGHQPSVWWSIGAFILVSGTVVALLSLIPGGA
ncbi:UDP-N-acetylmuramyl pentapeptide phosphotransferase [Microbacterium schleiferi]|uniref:UDP-N-acetylmuramyl pentapeptide phosphotransferase n=1 Tax=Microbacterium schleiferi TaxID=69362 RepID=UPI00311F3EA6